MGLEMALRGQTLLELCAWCAEPAEGKIELRPYHPGTKAKNFRDAKEPQIVPACGRHLNVTQEQPLTKPRRVRKQDEKLF